MHNRLAALVLALAGLGIAASPATAARAVPPTILQVSSINAIANGEGAEMYYSLGATVRFDRAITPAEQRSFGLITTSWTWRARLAPGTKLPQRLYGGTGVGRVGKAGRHCYRAELAGFRQLRSVTDGGSWIVALHDTDKILRASPRTKLKIGPASDSAAGCR
jgi:hypothetical protein